MDQNPPQPVLKPLQDAAGFTNTDPRTREGGFYPSFAKGRAVSVVEESSFIGPSAQAVGNGQYATTTVTTTSKSGALILAVCEWALFQDSLDTAHSLIPFYSNATSVDPTKYQFIGPFKSVLSSVSGASGVTNTPNVASDRLTVLNISAGSVTLYFAAQVRYIVNAGGAA